MLSKEFPGGLKDIFNSEVQLLYEERCEELVLTSPPAELEIVDELERVSQYVPFYFAEDCVALIGSGLLLCAS